MEGAVTRLRIKGMPDMGEVPRPALVIKPIPRELINTPAEKIR